MLKIRNYKFWSIFIFIEYLVYENVIFVFPDYYGGSLMKYIVYAYKILFPLILFQFWKFPLDEFRRNKNLQNFTIFFTLFILWSIVPTLFGGNIFSYVRLFVLLFFFIGFVGFINKNPKAIDFIFKLLIVYIVLTFLQYLFVVGLGYYETLPDRDLTGPYGILGNTRARIGFFDPPFIRMTGFWREPSNFSGAAFASFFTSIYLYKKESKSLWKISSYICLISGFLALSNAGFLSLGIALAISELYSRKKRTLSRYFRLIVISSFALFFIAFALYSRIYLTENSVENKYLRALAGVRTLSDKNYDASSGRIEGYSKVLNYINQNPFGIGVQITGANGIPAPAGALFFWLYLAGIPGITLLVFRDYNVAKKIMTLIKNDNLFKYPCLAFIVIYIQQSLYGSWLDPNFLIFSTIILIYQFKK